MNVYTLLESLTRRGITLRAEAGVIRFRAPHGALTPELRDTIRTSKAQILEHLSRAGAGGDFDPAPQLAKPLPPIRKPEQLDWVVPRHVFDRLREERERHREREIAEFSAKVRAGRYKLRARATSVSSRVVSMKVVKDVKVGISLTVIATVSVSVWA